jgi:hypothetical protein
MQQIATRITLFVRGLALCAALVLLAFIPSDVGTNAGAARPSGVISFPLHQPREVIARPLDLVEVDDPLAANAALPFATVSLESARGVNLFSAHYDTLARDTALECLTAAIYYEAGYEPLAGRRAVAQVVLNRVRHPLFPNSVCAVVYEGAERRTGCQFTFTCDGSLARRPAPAAWASARELARESLSGGVETSVGMATHYHANYVVPYWAGSLDKVALHGSHIFYQWKGSLGRRAAFSQALVADIPAEPLALEDLADASASYAPPDMTVPAPARSRIIADQLPAIGGEPPALGPTPALRLPDKATAGRLRADEQAGTLLADGTGAL